MRVLLVADTHLGFDLAWRPRVDRRRRGPDFFANLRQALAAVRQGQVDLVVHGGDLLYRSKVPARLVTAAFEPLLKVADTGVPVVVVPGNHERSAIPYPLLASHQHLHLVDQPRTIRLQIAGTSLALAGFPCERQAIRDRFGQLLAQTGWQEHRADVRLLCLHQTVEGARVGAGDGSSGRDYLFRSGEDIIRGRDIPAGFAAVLAGHIHRHQVLTRDLAGEPLAAPVLYPGSVERTSFAERHESKGFLILDLEADHGQPQGGGRLRRWSFRQLPARPMVDLRIAASGLDGNRLGQRLRDAFTAIDADAIVRLQIDGQVTTSAAAVLSAASLRALAPPTMTVDLRRPRLQRMPPR